MIKFDNVSKTYVSKSKSKVRALKNVSFELGNRGMVFILGKSGSGKSTLLNLLGGLDAPTGGVITVDGKSTEKFKQTDYDSYRNGYVGFVFQDFNLLKDFNVRDNVALALQLSNDDEIDKKVTDALAQVELSSEYLTRRVGELSGGERQRVAIARSLVKDSQLILADEPTGNLDSQTGESVWQLLKNLSQSKLVVVVSHDRESASKYADRVIEISDGCIVSDSGAQPQSDTEQKPFTPKNKSLNVTTSFKMGVNSIFKRKTKSISVILVAVFTILTLLITQMGLNFSAERTYAQFIKKYNVPYVNMSQGNINEDGYVFRNNRGNLRYEALKYISEQTDYIFDGIVESKQQILDFGFNFVGEAAELTVNSFYTTKQNLEKDDYLNILLNSNRSFYINDDGDKVYLARGTQRLPMEQLVGKQVYLQSLGLELPENNDDVPILAGIIDVSDEQDFFVSVPRLFALCDFVGYSYNYGDAINSHVNEYELSIGEGNYNGQFYLATTNSMYGRMLYTFVTADYGLVTSYTDVKAETLANYLADDDIVLSHALYKELFGAESQSYYVGSSLNELRNVPDMLGKRFSLKIYDTFGNVVVDLGNVRLAAVGFDGERTNYDPAILLVISSNARTNFNKQLHFGNSILVKTDKIANLSVFLQKLANEHNVYVYSVGGMHFTADEITVGGTTFTAEDLNQMFNSSVFSDGITITVDSVYIVEAFLLLMKTFLVFTGVLCAALLIILLLMVINLISFSITARKKEIGILSALGASTKDVTRIFIFETLVISAISFVSTLVLAVVFALTFNYVFCGTYEYTLPLFKVDIFTILTLVATSFGLLLLAAWIPIRKIAKLKPIDAIRHI